MDLRDLFRPRWQSKDAHTRLKSLTTIDDGHVLFTIIANDPDEAVVRAAILRLNDYEHLAQLVSLLDARRRSLVLTHITSQKTLAAIVAHNHYDIPESRELRKEVLARIVDTDVIYKLLRSPQYLALFLSRMRNYDLIIIAKDICEVKDSRVLFDVVMKACHDDSANVFGILLGAIHEQSLLARIVREHRCEYYRRMAIESIASVDTLGDFVIAGLACDSHDELSTLATRCLAESSPPEAIPMLIRILSTNRRLSMDGSVNIALEAIARLRTVAELPSSFKSVVQDKLPWLRDRLRSERPTYEMPRRGDDNGTDTMENERYTKLNEAVAWLEQL